MIVQTIPTDQNIRGYVPPGDIHDEIDKRNDEKEKQEKTYCPVNDLN